MAIEVDDEVELPTPGGPLAVRWAGDPVAHPSVEVVLARVGVLGDRPLVRIHSECLTGELLGSGRCDCGAQLAGALDLMRADPDGGVLAYVRGHEGRGIGLRNKLAAYRLQDAGDDTFTANRRLGLPEDGRRYDVPAAALAAAGLRRIRLLTDNPHKVDAARAAGLEVDQRRLDVDAPPTSAGYLRAKLAWFGVIAG
jgi:3,4-dihydroxy 2-butanone 4-phosphate synthase/GTP cyclohydrolase II